VNTTVPEPSHAAEKAPVLAEDADLGSEVAAILKGRSRNQKLGRLTGWNRKIRSVEPAVGNCGRTGPW